MDQNLQKLNIIKITKTGMKTGPIIELKLDQDWTITGPKMAASTALGYDIHSS